MRRVFDRCFIESLQCSRVTPYHTEPRGGVPRVLKDSVHEAYAGSGNMVREVSSGEPGRRGKE